MPCQGPRDGLRDRDRRNCFLLSPREHTELILFLCFSLLLGFSVGLPRPGGLTIFWGCQSQAPPLTNSDNTGDPQGRKHGAPGRTSPSSCLVLTISSFPLPCKPGCSMVPWVSDDMGPSLTPVFLWLGTSSPWGLK